MSKEQSTIQASCLCHLHSMNKTTIQEANCMVQTPKRGLETSPNDSPVTPEQDRIVKAPRMTQNADKNDIQELKELITNTTNEFKIQCANINESLVYIRNDITSTKKDLDDIKSRVEMLENAEQHKASEIMEAELNALKQIQLESQLSIHNIPKNIDAKEALECLSIWSKCNLNESVIKRASIGKKDEKVGAVLYLDFYNTSDKHKLMNHVKSAQRDANNKYIPILTDQIFKLNATDIARGLELNFRGAMTDRNREIFNAARKEKKIFTSVQVNQGYVMVKINKDKPIKISSIHQLKSIIMSQQRINGK